MKLYKKLLIENQYNEENLQNIKKAAEDTIEGLGIDDDCHNGIEIDGDGFIDISFTQTELDSGNTIDFQDSLQEQFDQDFAYLIRMECPELTH